MSEDTNEVIKEEPVKNETTIKPDKRDEEIFNLKKQLNELMEKNKIIDANLKEEQKKQLEKEGKLLDAAKLQIDTLTSQLTESQKLIEEGKVFRTKIEQDRIIMDKLSGVKFINSKARDYFKNEIENNFKRDEKSGHFIDATGKDIDKYLAEASKDTTLSFLFEQQSSVKVPATAINKQPDDIKKSNKPVDPNDFNEATKDWEGFVERMVTPTGVT